ncbi:translation initiation factor IF-2-like [Meles meles]|uniref:translation initiation factor IF-2-like n=1 Tax=Meles meles TaxID=9662 RepID=UPI001E69F5FC|nr:translation initiation factor IF-2-like [Meles meles]
MAHNHEPSTEMPTTLLTVPPGRPSLTQRHPAQKGTGRATQYTRGWGRAQRGTAIEKESPLRVGTAPNGPPRPAGIRRSEENNVLRSSVGRETTTPVSPASPLLSGQPGELRTDTLLSEKGQGSSPPGSTSQRAADPGRSSQAGCGAPAPHHWALLPPQGRARSPEPRSPAPGSLQPHPSQGSRGPSGAVEEGPEESRAGPIQAKTRRTASLRGKAGRGGNGRGLHGQPQRPGHL